MQASRIGLGVTLTLHALLAAVLLSYEPARRALLAHAVKVVLPKAASEPNITRPDNVQIAIDAEGVTQSSSIRIPFEEGT